MQLSVLAVNDSQIMDQKGLIGVDMGGRNLCAAWMVSFGGTCMLLKDESELGNLLESVGRNVSIR